MKMSSYTIPNNTFLPKDALKLIIEPPELPWGHLFEPGAGCEGGIQKPSLTGKAWVIAGVF